MCLKSSYNRLIAQQQRLHRKLERLVNNVISQTFYGQPQFKSNAIKRLEKRISKISRVITGMRVQMKLGVAAAITSGAFLIAKPADAQLAFNSAQMNHFGLSNAGTQYIFTTLVDLDNDGDADLMMGSGNGSFTYYENTGTASLAAFESGQNNPFGLTNTPPQSAPTFVDLDNDGDWDLVVGETGGNFYYFENTGAANAPAFAGSQLNPFGLADIGYNTNPVFADLDNDGDMDMVAGTFGATIHFLENTGSANAPAFAAAQAGPFGIPGFGLGVLHPALVDLDKDGDQDLVVGDNDGVFHYLENTGSVSAPAFSSVQTNPFGLSDIGSDSTPTFADLDNDGDQDLMSGQVLGNFFYFENVSVVLGAAAPQSAFKYQAAIRDTLGVPMANQSISIKASIVSDSANGTAVYSEAHTVNSNQFGLINLNIGSGTVFSGYYDAINWSNGNFFLKIEMDETGGTNYSPLSEARLLSVPYALFAQNVANDADGQTLSFSGSSLSISNGKSIDLDSLDTDTDDQTLTFSGTNVSISEGNSVDLNGLRDNLGDHTAKQNISLNGNWLSGDGGAEGIQVDNVGNVGIGTASPSHRLHVSGDIYATGEINSSGAIKPFGISLPHGFGPDTNFVGSAGNYIAFGHSGTSEDFIGYANHTFYFKDSPGGGDISDPNVSIGGSLGLGTDTPAEKLHVVGNICYTGSSSSCSDLRYKKDITILPNVLEKLEQINGVSYNWRVEEFPEKGFDNTKQIGVIAQELEQVYPELVITDDNGYKTVDYPKLTAILIEAIKSQQSTIAILEIANKRTQHELQEIKTFLGMDGNAQR